MEKEIKEKIKKLIEKYEEVKKSGRLKSYTEQETKMGFIEPLFEALGWDTSNKKEVSAEESIISSGRVDYGFYLNDRIKFYLEAKPLRADLNKEEYANQAIKYSWNKGATWAVLTDFESIKVFNAQDIERKLYDKLLFEIPYTQFIERFDEIWLLSKEAFEDDLLDKGAEKRGKKIPKISITSLLYKDLQKCRDILINELGQWNEKINPDLLDEGVQKLLDRLIFIRVAEDRGIEDSTLRPLLRQAREEKKGYIYQSMVKKFREFDEFYNSNLFSPHPFEDWEDYGATDDVINILYGKEGYYEYDFKVMPSDVLGAVYENYLSHRLLKSKKGTTVAKDAKKRKEQGIYYTPNFIVDYIVKNALGPVLDKCRTINDIKKIKVLDPACGSGSFLIKAAEMIYEKYKEFSFGANESLLKISILEENIYGVDLDSQAVEITRLNLLIDALSKREKFPLLDNIKNGNSLVSGTDEELKKYFGKNFREKKPFNWQEEFPEVFKQGGFDVIIGNPPWGANIDEEIKYLEDHYPNSTKEKKDTYKTFIDKAVNLLKPEGVLGFIIPNSFLYQPSYEDILKIIEQYFYNVINLGEKIFNGVELPCCILILNKNHKKNSVIVDFTQEKRDKISSLLKSIDFIECQKLSSIRQNITQKTFLTFDDVFILKDAGIQYHRSGIGLSNKGGNDLYERIFCAKSDNKFKNIKETWYGKLIERYYIENETDELFNLDYKSVLKKKESVSFTKKAFEEKEKILWRQTAASLVSVLDNKMRWFRNTIQCGFLKKEYERSVNLYYALSIFNSKYIDYVYRQRVLETGRVFPQVKIKYLKRLPFIISSMAVQKYLAELADKMLQLNKEMRKTAENSEKWKSIKSEIKKTDKKIDEEVYKLYGLTNEEIKIVENFVK